MLFIVFSTWYYTIYLLFCQVSPFVTSPNLCPNYRTLIRYSAKSRSKFGGFYNITDNRKPVFNNKIKSAGKGSFL